jgi:RNA polymerase sigma factor (sigma-70 family)
MANSPVSRVIQQLRGALLAREGGCLTDGQLLECFVSRREEAAFEALVRRLGPMVLGVCRRLLRNHHDAEDAFQATFLVLVRKAAAVVPREMIANWLYGVAYQTAWKARTMAGKRRLKEKQVTEMPEPAAAQDLGNDLQTLLDQELTRLPDKYRAPIVLCDLQGKPRKEAARQLGQPEGTLSSRLARARALLAKRLARHGFTLTGGALAAALAEGTASALVPASLIDSTVQAAFLFAAGQAAAAGAISARAIALTEGVLKAMLLTKLKIATAVVLALAVVVGTAASSLTARTPGATQLLPAKQNKQQRTADDGDKPKTDTKPAAKKSDAPADGFENAVGWTWYEEPRLREGFGLAMGTSNRSLETGYSALFEVDKDGAVRVYLSYRRNQSALDFRPVAFDEDRKRYPLTSTGGAGHSDVMLVGFRLDPQLLPAAKAKYLGFEFLTSDGNKLRAADALKRAKTAKVEVLPFPEVGRAYDFALTTRDGQKATAKDLQGKVVLIDCWATWCTPCMDKMPMLQQLYEKHKKVGLEIIGVCFDEKAEKANQAIKRLGLSWPQVFVPADEKSRELWYEAGGSRSLPKLMLLDRAGILRADCGPGDLESQITKLLEEKKTGESKP